MSIGSRLTHVVDIVRPTDTGSFDDYNQPTVTEAVLASVKASIQPKDAREQQAFSQAGAGISDHTVFLLPTDIKGSDAIEHDPDDCPLTRDLPFSRFEIDGIRNAAGIGHHLEVDVHAVNAPADATGS